jgi:DNA-binding MarR family transcriptional regulator
VSPKQPNRQPVSADPDPAHVTWQRLLSLFVQRRDATFAVLGESGLTPPHGIALSILVGGPVRMRDLADQMSCDASYITSVVDRLESVGFARRVADPLDRRAKLIELTELGTTTAAAFRDLLTQPPVEFKRLTKAERVSLSELVAKLVPNSTAIDDFFRVTPRS